MGKHVCVTCVLITVNVKSSSIKQFWDIWGLPVGNQELAEACLHPSLAWFTQWSKSMTCGFNKAWQMPLALSSYSWQQTLREKNTFTVYGKKGMLTASRKNMAPYMAVKAMQGALEFTAGCKQLKKKTSSGLHSTWILSLQNKALHVLRYTSLSYMVGCNFTANG